MKTVKTKGSIKQLEIIRAGVDSYDAVVIREVGTCLYVADIKKGSYDTYNPYKVAETIVEAVNNHELLMRIVKELQKYKEAGEEYIRFEALMTDSPEADDTTFGDLIDKVGE